MAKVKISIDVDEWYPVYSILDTLHGKIHEVDEELVERWNKAYAEFHAVQDILSKIEDGV